MSNLTSPLLEVISRPRGIRSEGEKEQGREREEVEGEEREEEEE